MNARAISADEVVLTPEGFTRLEEELRRLTSVARPAAAARLAQALDLAGDLADDSEYFDACAERDRVEERIELLERRLSAARVLLPGQVTSEVVALGSHVVLDDLDQGTHEDYLLVSSAESAPAEGRISDESPIGRAISGHHKGDVVEVHAPRRIRHLRIADLNARRRRTPAAAR